MAIRDIETKLFRVPLREVLVDAAHGDHTHFELVTVTITTEDGRDAIDAAMDFAFGRPMRVLEDPYGGDAGWT